MIFTYHEITPELSSYIYSVERLRFVEHLAYIHAQAPGRAAVSFDDGHASHHRYGLPLLNQFGLRGTFFITAGWTGVHPEYMDWTQLGEMVREGHQVHSHGWSHAFLTACTDSELDEELRRSRDTLEDHLGISVTGISMPGGRWDRRVTAACARAGYTEIYTSDPWMKTDQSDGVSHYGRCMVSRSMDPQYLGRVLTAESRSFDLLRLRQPIKRLAQTIVGDRLYQSIWRKFGSWNQRQNIREEYMDRIAAKGKLG